MASLVAGTVSVNDDGVASFTPPDPADSYAGASYVGSLAAIDAFIVANGGEVPPAAERVKLLQWLATDATERAAPIVAYLTRAR